MARYALSALTLLTVLTPLHAGVIAIDFEAVPELSSVGNFYSGAGVVFTGATVLTETSSLDELNYPAFSSPNVASAFNPVGGTPDPMTIAINPLATSFKGYFTYSDGLTLTFFRGADIVGFGFGQSNDNRGMLGNGMPNELVTFQLAEGFDKISITGGDDPFTVDSIELNVPDATVVPEPGTTALMAVGAAACAFWRRRSAGGASRR